MIADALSATVPPLVRPPRRGKLVRVSAAADPIVLLPLDAAVEFFVAAAGSRRLAKQFLHDRGLPSTGASVNLAIARLATRDDFAEVTARGRAVVRHREHEAARLARRADTLDLAAAANRELAARGHGIERLAERAGASVDDVRRFLAGDDVPLSVAQATLRALGATHVRFASRST